MSTPPKPKTGPKDLDERAIDIARALAMDAVQKANSGHPGTPMALAPLAHTLFQEVLRHDPTDPHWAGRDRFVLSAGHASMLLYAQLYLTGYGLSLDDVTAFRQWESRTPGHPEYHHTAGVETTTGPLGQGVGNAVGMAMALRHTAAVWDPAGDSGLFDPTVYVICSDGDLQEGIAAEAASLAGHQRLGNLVLIWDDNHISIEGDTAVAFTEDVLARFAAYGFGTDRVDDAEDRAALRAAVERARDDRERPTIIAVRSHIGWPSPTKMDTGAAHGSPLGEDEVRATKEILGWDPDAHFLVPDGVYEHFSAVARGCALQGEWERRFREWRDADAERAAEWDAAWAGRPLPGVVEALREIDWGKDKLATRAAGQKAMAAFAECVPTMVGGAADLSESTKTEFPGADDERYTREHARRNVFFGVREHGMGASVNGLCAHGGIVRPYGSTFLQFADYMRGSVRLSALTALPVAWVYTHDSVGLGEDGPTHQPVEHLAALRAIPGLTVIRPGDANETAAAWRTILEDLDGPAVLVLSRQDLPVLADASAEGVARGAYVLRDADDPAVVLVGTGSELSVALEAADRLDSDGVRARVVSMPSWELFAAQDEAYRDAVLPPGLPSVSVEAGISQGWERWVDRSVSIDRFGASAPGAEVLHRLGITAEAVAGAAVELVAAVRT